MSLDPLLCSPAEAARLLGLSLEWLAKELDLHTHAGFVYVNGMPEELKKALRLLRKLKPNSDIFGIKPEGMGNGSAAER